jgi:hypothetical protein
MTYEIKHGPDLAALEERVETATGCLERLEVLEAEQSSNVKIYDRDGREITLAELEKLAAKEML